MNYTFKIGNGIKNVSWIIVFVVIIQKMVSPEMYFMINLALLLYFIAISKSIPVSPIWGFWILLLFVAWGILAGLQSINVDALRDYERDIYYYINPLVFMLNGVFYAKVGYSFSKYCNSLILGNLFHVVMYVVSLVTGGELGGITGYLYVPMAILLFYPLSEKESFKKSTRMVILALYLLPFAISFSRTAIIVVLTIVICVTSYKCNMKKVLSITLRMGVIVVAAIIAFYSFLPADKQKLYIEKIDNSTKEITYNQDWNDPLVVTKNWRGYEAYCAMEEFKRGNAIEQIFGYGFSKRISVGKYAYVLLDQENADGTMATDIAVTHNGYANILVKLGLLGVVMLLVFYFSIIIKSYKISKKYDAKEARVLMGILVAEVFMTYILNGLYKDVCYYGMITTIGYLGYRMKYIDKYYDSDESDK